MGNEIAFPHARLDHLNHPIFAVATLEEPVLFGDQQTRLACLVLVPASDPSVSLKIMAKFSRVLLEDGGHERVLSAQTPEALRSLFEQEKESVDSPIFARDIMRMPRWGVPENTTISECAKMMSNYHLRAIPVLNAKKEIVGEITADLLFKYGLPDFFVRLKSVSFVAEFDPFEKYFKDERETPTSEVMSRQPCIVSPEHTVMEIVFDLAVKNFHKLYVVDSRGKWVGTVTKGTLLDNVINV
jgi:CBS domain-containing protein